MSRSNRFTPRQLTHLLRHMYTHPRGQEFILTLPYSGEPDLSWEDRLAEPSLSRKHLRQDRLAQRRLHPLRLCQGPLGQALRLFDSLQSDQVELESQALSGRHPARPGRQRLANAQLLVYDLQLLTQLYDAGCRVDPGAQAGLRGRSGFDGRPPPPGGGRNYTRSGPRHPESRPAFAGRSRATPSASVMATSAPSWRKLERIEPAPRLTSHPRTESPT